MQTLKTARINTAGAYVSVGGLFPFHLGWKLSQGRLPVVRLGGHVEGNETGWECARREAAEEAGIQIHPIPHSTTYLAYGDSTSCEVKEIQWEHECRDAYDPLLVVAYQVERQASLSLMYLAQTDEMPIPAGEVRGLLLLDPGSIRRICAGPVTLEQYLSEGGKAILNHDYDRSRVLEPFKQLRIFNRLLQNQSIPIQ